MSRYRLPPPSNAESVVGTGFEFTPEDDLLGQPPDPPLVELRPTGITVAPSASQVTPEPPKGSDGKK